MTAKEQAERDCAAFILSGMVQSVIGNGFLTEFDVKALKLGINDLRRAHGIEPKYQDDKQMEPA